ncbi:Ig-like domain repeat protein [Catenulispora sp. NF23]|uniref:Ig-like domain repeat protein n=1 Tax=Catenulispora pinistramenti TaxID=2705254 RepID=UPI001BA9C490|nr:Ig-like domain repeat protein [Catenulispora pinistramenti]MBS2539395.1 Ig-like domain repeat protein [Catenulispora pinistramenti]
MSRVLVLPALSAAALLCVGGLGALPASASARAQAAVHVSDPPTGQLAYLSVGGSFGTPNAVAVVDTRTDALVDFRTITQYLSGIAADPAGAEVYGTAQGALVVLDAATDATLATITVGGANSAVAVNPSGTRAYVADADGSGSTDVVDTTTRTVTATIPAGGHRLALNPAGTVLYTTSTAGTLAVIDTGTDTVVGTVPCGTSGGSVAVNATGTRVYVADAATRELCVIDTATNTVTATVTLPSGSNPMAVAVNPAGTTAYVSTGPTARIYAIDLQADAVSTSFPSAISVAEALDPTGSPLYVADENPMGSGSFAALDTGSGTNLGTNLGAVRLEGQPSDIALGPVATGTTTALTISPSGTATQGTAVTLTATVSGATSGTVQFYDSALEGAGTVPLGAPVPVTDGTATFSTTALTADTHTLSAAFSPSQAGLLRSASAPVTLQVEPQ